MMVRSSWPQAAIMLSWGKNWVCTLWQIGDEWSKLIRSDHTVPILFKSRLWRTSRRRRGKKLRLCVEETNLCVRELPVPASSFKKRTLEYLDWKLAMAPKNEWWMRILPCRLPMIEWEPQKCTLNSNNHTLMEYPMRKALEWNHWEWRAETSFLYFHIMGSMSIYAQILLMWMWDGVWMENELLRITVIAVIFGKR